MSRQSFGQNFEMSGIPRGFANSSFDKVFPGFTDAPPLERGWALHQWLRRHEGAPVAWLDGQWNEVQRARAAATRSQIDDAPDEVILKWATDLETWARKLFAITPAERDNEFNRLTFVTANPPSPLPLASTMTSIDVSFNPWVWLSNLKDRGINVEIDGDRLKFSPAVLMTEADRATARKNKAAIHAHAAGGYFII